LFIKCQLTCNTNYVNDFGTCEEVDDDVIYRKEEENIENNSNNNSQTALIIISIISFIYFVILVIIIVAMYQKIKTYKTKENKEISEYNDGFRRDVELTNGHIPKSDSCSASVELCVKLQMRMPV
jgi:ATP-dependent Zn protease